MKKVIISSYHLGVMLNNLPKQDCTVKVNDGQLRIGELIATVESKLNFEYEITAKQFKTLRKICKHLDEQPIVLDFGQETHWIHLSSVVI